MGVEPTTSRVLAVDDDASVTGTRDSNNARDLEQRISGNQTGLMTINCVDGAAD